MQKALRSLELGYDGFDEQLTLPLTDEAPTSWLRAALARAGSNPVRGRRVPRRLDAEQVFDATKIDPWFLSQIEDLLREEAQLVEQGFESLELPRLRSLEAQGLLRCAHRAPGARDEPAIRSRRRKLGSASGVQARRHLRRGILDLDRLPVFDLRGGVRGESQLAPQDHDFGRRPEPHRSGHRIRLLLRACGHGAARGRLRDHHGELQSRDGLDRLRHLRSAVLRAADVRGRHGDHREGEARRGDRAVRRPDAAEAVAGARGGRRAHHRHDAGQHRHRRGPRALPEAGDEL
jgi:hypothetical protein